MRDRIFEMGEGIKKEVKKKKWGWERAWHEHTKNK